MLWSTFFSTWYPNSFLIMVVITEGRERVMVAGVAICISCGCGDTESIHEARCAAPLPPFHLIHDLSRFYLLNIPFDQELNVYLPLSISQHLMTKVERSPCFYANTWAAFNERHHYHQQQQQRWWRRRRATSRREVPGVQRVPGRRESSLITWDARTGKAVRGLLS